MDVKEKKYSCDRCGEGFKTNHRWSLLRHIKNIHEGDVNQVTNKEEKLKENSKKKVQGGVHKCQEAAYCTYKTTDLRNFKRHIRTKHRLNRQKKCLYCNYQTTSTELLRRHKIEHKNECLARHHCSVCKLVFNDSESFENHLNKRHPKSNAFEMIQTAFSKHLRVYCKNIREKAADTKCLWDSFKDFKSLCRRISAKEFPVFRLNICMYGVFEKSSPVDDDEEKETDVFVLKSAHFTIKPHSKLKNIHFLSLTNFQCGHQIDGLLRSRYSLVLNEVLL